MADPWHVEWLREGVHPWNKRRKRIDFSPDLRGVNFFELLPQDFRDAPKTSRYFERIDLSGACLDGADLSNLNFHRANFSGSSLVNTDLSKSNLTYVDFAGAIFQQTNLQRAHLDYAKFRQVDLASSDLSNVSAVNAIMISAGVSPEQQARLTEVSALIFNTEGEFVRSKAIVSAISGGTSLHFKVASGGGVAPIDDRTKKNVFEVYFGTNRVPVHIRGVLSDFSGERSPDPKTVHYGICQVSLPASRRIGSLGSPLWQRLLNRKDDRISLSDLISLNSDLFWAAVRRSYEQMKIKHVPTIFVHGYKSTFHEAVLRTAQIGYDLGLGQGAGLFSWPSKGAFLKYAADEAASEASKFALAGFILDFAEKSGAEQVNIIGHSMGCRCIIGAIETLKEKGEPVRKLINKVILAAADVDVGSMKYLGPKAIALSSGITSYVSDKDKALRLSSWLHDFDRVGLAPPTFILDGIDTVHVNDDNLGSFSHGYIGSSRIVLGDVFSILKDGAKPEERFGLECVVDHSGRYWRIKD